MRRLSLPLTAALVGLLAAPSGAAASYLYQANPFIGTGGQGNTFVGAQVPFGFAAPGPDTVLSSPSGYVPGQPIVGFSLTHESGTGGAAKYGNFRITPAAGPTAVPSLPANEQASPGYYSVLLSAQNIRAEMTASRMAALQRFTYPPIRGATLTLNATSVIPTQVFGQVVKQVWVKVTGRRSFEGGGIYSGGWGQGTYRLAFYAELDRKAKLIVLPGRTGVVARFDTRKDHTINLRVGLSFTSATMAKRHLSDLPGFNFNAARRNAQSQWRRALGEIQVRGGSADQRRIFATALYHSHLMPHDVSDDGGWPSSPHYEDFFTIWDTFRTQDPLILLTEPQRMTDMVNSLITTYKLTGWLPDARVGASNGWTQVGSNGDILVADAMVKKLPGIDYRTAYKALAKDATVESPAPLFFGRVLADWDKLGYVALDQPRSASRTLEYSYDNFAIGEVAKLLGHPGTAARYIAQASNWGHLWDPSTQSIRPRNPDGTFLDPFRPKTRSFGNAPFYEGSPLEWSTFVPHDVQGLITRLGGDQQFVKWLNGVMACCYDPGNEPDLLAPYLYIHAGRPDLTDAAVRRLLANNYGTGRDGLPGNDDAGTLSAWYVWAAIGLFPNAGQPYYYISAPIFSESRISLGGRRSLTIEAPGASTSNRYVVGAELNGHVLQRSFLTSSEVEHGGTLRLKLASHPNGWGSGPRPFSLSANGGRLP